MEKPDLVFLTETNQEKIGQEIEPALLEAKLKELEMKRAEASAPERLPDATPNDQSPTV